MPYLFIDGIHSLASAYRRRNRHGLAILGMLSTNAACASYLYVITHSCGGPVSILAP